MPCLSEGDDLGTISAMSTAAMKAAPKRIAVCRFMLAHELNDSAYSGRKQVALL